MKFYILSPESVPLNPHLFPMWKKTFEERGHSFVGRIEDCDCVLFDLHTRIADYEQSDIDYLLQTRIPVISFCEYDRGGLSNEIWPCPVTFQQYAVFSHIKSNNIKSVHFCRLLDKTKTYPLNLYPYEKPILHEEPLCSAGDLFNREYDICFIANSSPNRERIKQVLGADGRLRCNIKLGQQKIPFKEWLNEHRKAKLFITASAGGFTDERMQALFSIAGMIRERTDQLLLHEFLAENNCCIKINSEPTQEDLDMIVEIVNDKEWLYGIYKNGYDFIKSHYTKEHIANYIVDTIEKHL